MFKFVGQEQLKYFLRKLKNIFVESEKLDSGIFKSQQDVISIDYNKLCNNTEFINALCENSEFIEQIRTKLGVSTTEKPGLLPQLPE